jgi:hypothetical protein
MRRADTEDRLSGPKSRQTCRKPARCGPQGLARGVKGQRSSRITNREGTARTIAVRNEAPSRYAPSSILVIAELGDFGSTECTTSFRARTAGTSRPSAQEMSRKCITFQFIHISLNRSTAEYANMLWHTAAVHKTREKPHRRRQRSIERPPLEHLDSTDLDRRGQFPSMPRLNNSTLIASNEIIISTS